MNVDIKRSWSIACVCSLLALHIWLALTSTIDLGVTADETAHLTGGYSYWRWNDYRLQPENGNLPQRWAALPLLLTQPRLEPSDYPEYWKRSHVWLIGQKFFFESGNNTELNLFYCRAWMLTWSVALGLLVLWWGKQLWGTSGSLVSLAFYSISPTILANAPLITSDVCAASCLLASASAWWLLLHKFTYSRLLFSLSAIALAVVSKFSFLILAPVFIILAGLRIVSVNKSARTKYSIVYLWLAFLHLAAAWLSIWACFGFRYSAFNPQLPIADKFFVSWDEVMPKAGFWHWLIQSCRQLHVLPEAFLQGFAYMLSASKERAAFALGYFSTTGWWWFFPFCFLVKSSLAELGLAGTIFAYVIRKSSVITRDLLRGKLYESAPLLALGLIYTLLAVTSNLNIGHRHILVIYPLMFIGAGCILNLSHRFSRHFWLSLLVIMGAFETATIYPHYLPFFNYLAGGPSNGWRLLVDSSLDWGQNLPRLQRWLANNTRPADKIYVSIYGSDDLFYHGIHATELSPGYSFGRRRKWVELESGYYCVSATMLQDLTCPFPRTWTPQFEAAYQKLKNKMRFELTNRKRSHDVGEFGLGPEQPLWNLDRARFARLTLYLSSIKPRAVIGYSIFIYHISDQEAKMISDGSIDDLADMIARAHKSSSR